MKLVSIGYLGLKTVYIDKTKEEAIAAFNEENPGEEFQEGVHGLHELTVTDRFGAYDIWEQ